MPTYTDGKLDFEASEYIDYSGDQGFRMLVLGVD